jgi:hypothetical protein
MKRPVVTALLLCAVATLAGCPIYDHNDDGCRRSSDCGPGYSCNQDTGDCFQPNDNSCSKPSDCGVNQTCTKAGECVAGDCSFSSCVSGYTCDPSSGTWGCVLTSSIGAAGAGNEGGAAGATGLPLAGAGGAAGQTSSN